MPAYLHSGFSQVDFECQLLSGVDVRVVGLGKDPLQLLQLGAGERGPDAPLLPLLVQSSVIREELVGNCEPNQMSHTRRSRLGCRRYECSCGVVRWKQSQIRYFVQNPVKDAELQLAIVLRL